MSAMSRLNRTCFLLAIAAVCVGGFLQGLGVAPALRHAIGYATVALWLLVIALTIRGSSE